MRKRPMNIDGMLMNSLVIILILASALSLVMMRDFIGYVGYHSAKGGVITEINVYQIYDPFIWSGIYGIALSGVALNTSWFVYSEPSGMDELNPIFACFEPGIVHELYATPLNFTQIDWDQVSAGTTEFIDQWINLSGVQIEQSMRTNITFTETISVDIGDRTISNVPAVYLKQYSSPGSQEYPVGILQYDGYPIIVAIINPNYLMGYRPDKIFNYEMIVPIPRSASQVKYNIFTDPFDECPDAGTGEFPLPAGIHGWVKDLSTGLFLNSTLVSIEKKIFITGPDGYYNMSDIIPGDYYVVGLKTGYNNYVHNVTLYENESVEHNFSMEVFRETLTGTGPGVGTGPGQDSPGESTSDGIGPGVGPSIGPYIEKPLEYGAVHWRSLELLKKKIKIGNYFTDNLLIFSFQEEPAKISLKVSGNASEILEINQFSSVIEQNQYANISIRGFGAEEGVYTGSIDISGDFNDTMPVIITVTSEDKLPVEALLMQLEVLTARPLPGNKFRFRLNLQNLLIEENYDVKLDYYIKGVDADTVNYSMHVGNDTVDILTTYSLIKETVIPPDWPKGDYYLIIEAQYLDLESRTSTLFEVFEPLHQYKVFGVLEIWKLLSLLASIAALIIAIIIIRKRMDSQKRFHAKVEYNLLPKKGPRSLYVGKLAETEIDTYLDMDKLTVHSIIAGSTGGGKSISAQVIVEEALLKGVAVIVFDPTAQWSGMLRKCTDEKMLGFYPRFHLTRKDARAFSGNIRAIKNPRERIDLMKYWKPGEIQVITTSTLDPKDMDIFVANTVREVFHSNLQEYRGLRMMMVYDEVHRLLPKFGGSGEGFIQIERACREFRKWGIGVMLVSQVLADFVGQIKANINTEIQMKTRDEGDLQRIETKYGKSYIQELVKAPVGSGMIQNSDWNRGKPYYITFRPILHSVVRLTDQELEQYNKYNEIVEDLQYQLEQLEQEGKDVFDLKLELKLSLDKIKSGSFNMVEIYLEGLKPRIEKVWRDLGKQPKKRETDLISQDEIKAAISAAKQDSDKAAAAQPQSTGQPIVKKVLGLNDDVAPDKMLKLMNGTLVIKLKALLDEIKALKENEFKAQVNEDKNDFADWIRNAVGNDSWADIADTIIAKEDFTRFLELLDSGKEKTFKITVSRPKPYSSKAAAVQPALQAAKPAAQPTVPSSGAQEKTGKEKIDLATIKKNILSLQGAEKLAYLKKAADENAEIPELQFLTAVEYHKSKDIGNAEAYYKRAVGIKPDYGDAQFYLGTLYYSMKKFAEAKECLKKAKTARPDYPKIDAYLSDIEARLK
ncbi:MAG: DUF87 domain-containing protein [Nanoarchaeota archaeon]|nr:DUF87 domain-containing protein [Nanoarchaeota archaeon]